MANLDQIAEIKAIWDMDGMKVSGLVQDRILKRKWTQINSLYLQQLAETLRLRTSLKNPADGKKYYSVLNPLVNGLEYQGRWRGGLVETFEDTRETGKIVQTLRWGWLDTLLDGSSNVDFTEARIRQGRFLQDQPTGSNTSPDEKHLEIYWPSCSNEKVKTMVDQLAAPTFTNPTIEGQQHAGIWHNNLVIPSMAEDGSKIITMFLGISHFRLDGFTNWLTHRVENVAYLWGYSKDESQSIAEAWKAKGRTCRLMYDRTNGLVDIVLAERDYTSTLTISSATGAWNCRYKEVVDSYFGVSDPTLYPITTTPANGISYDRQVRDNGDGSWDIIVTTRNVQYRDIPFQTSAISADATETTRQQLGLTTQTQESMASEDGIIKRQVVEVRDDCSKDVITRKETVTDIEKTSYDHDGLVHRTVTDHSAASSALTEEVPAQGQAIQIVNEKTPYPGKTRTRRVVEESQAVTGAEYVSHYGERSTEYTTDVEHDTSYPDIDNLTTSGIETAVLSHNLDKFLTHNYRKLRSVKKFPFDGEVSYVIYGDYELATSQEYSPALGRYWNNMTYVYQRKATVTKKYFRTESEAVAYINGSFLTDNSGSHVSHTGEFEYLATKVVNTKSLVTTYTYLEPTS